MRMFENETFHQKAKTAPSCEYKAASGKHPSPLTLKNSYSECFGKFPVNC